MQPAIDLWPAKTHPQTENLAPEGTKQPNRNLTLANVIYFVVRSKSFGFMMFLQKATVLGSVQYFQNKYRTQIGTIAKSALVTEQKNKFQLND